MKIWSSVVSTLALVGLVGCSSEPSAKEGDTGALSVALVGVASDGTAYRLRNAEFEITGYPQFFESTNTAGAGGSAGAPPTGGAAGVITGGAPGGEFFFEVVSSETDPDEPMITRRVVPGSYFVHFFSQDWFVERITPSGPERVESSVLLSERTQFAFVWNGGSSDVAYRFGVDGQPIDFRSGDLNIRIEIERPGEGATGGFGGFGGFAGFGGTGGSGPTTGGSAGAPVTGGTGG